MNPQRLEIALACAERLGATAAEIFGLRENDLTIQVSKGEVENLSVAESIGVGARVFTRDHQVGFAYTTQLDKLDDVVEAAWNNARQNTPDAHNILPDVGDTSEDDWTVDAPDAFSRVPIEEKVALARRLESQVLAADARIESVPQASYGEGAYECALVNSRGLRRWFRSAAGSCSVSAKAAVAGHDPESGWEFSFGRRLGALNVEETAAGCVEKALRKLGGEPCATGMTPIVLDRYVVVQFLGLLGASLRADSVLKGKSMYAGRVGEPIAAECVDLFDQNDHADAMSRWPFDAEGVAAQTTSLISNGVLRGYLHDAYTAHRMGVASTANAVRGGFRSTPEVGMTTCWLKAGAYSPEELFRQVGDGLWVTDVIGMHTANAITGDFSVGVEGCLIRNGALDRPVRGATMAGNLKDVLVDVQAIGNDLRFFWSGGAASLRLGGLMISGVSR